MKNKQALKAVKSRLQTKNLKNSLFSSLLSSNLCLPIFFIVNAVGISFGSMMLLEQVLPAQAQSAVQELLNTQNIYRSQVGVPPLKWNNSLSQEAQNYANYLASHRLFQHSNVRGEGENLWMGTSRRFKFTQMIQNWGDEKRLYRPGEVITQTNYHSFGHYTQMVWRKTTQVGCGGAEGKDGQYRLVCRYSPAGNTIGQRPY